MKRSEINRAVRDASLFFKEHHWTLPPSPKWDVTDFGLGEFRKYGLVLVNLAEEPEYCEKMMYAVKDQRTPFHSHKQKKEDIIVRNGTLAINLFKGSPAESKEGETFQLQVNGILTKLNNGDTLTLNAGERITLVPGICHEFWPVSDACILGEVSTANDDLHDNFFFNPEIGRFSAIEEDEAPVVKLISD